MLPRVVPSAKIFTFTWDSNYYQNAPVVRIRDVADTLLRKLQDQRDEVISIQWFHELSDFWQSGALTRGRSSS